MHLASASALCGAAAKFDVPAADAPPKLPIAFRLHPVSDAVNVAVPAGGRGGRSRGASCRARRRSSWRQPARHRWWLPPCRRRDPPVHKDHCTQRDLFGVCCKCRREVGGGAAPPVQRALGPWAPGRCAMREHGVELAKKRKWRTERQQSGAGGKSRVERRRVDKQPATGWSGARRQLNECASQQGRSAAE